MLVVLRNHAWNLTGCTRLTGAGERASSLPPPSGPFQPSSASRRGALGMFRSHTCTWGRTCTWGVDGPSSHEPSHSTLDSSAPRASIRRLARRELGQLPARGGQLELCLGRGPMRSAAASARPAPARASVRTSFHFTSSAETSRESRELSESNGVCKRQGIAYIYGSCTPPTATRLFSSFRLRSRLRSFTRDGRRRAPGRAPPGKLGRQGPLAIEAPASDHYSRACARWLAVSIWHSGRPRPLRHRHQRRHQPPSHPPRASRRGALLRRPSPTGGANQVKPSASSHVRSRQAE